MREYIVTCKTKEDLQSLYDDMETPGGNLYIPDREVELVHRRLVSRNTHYMLTDEEAELVSQDERVLGVELNWEDAGIEFVSNYTISGESDIPSNDPAYTIDSNRWSKSTNNSNTHRPWSMLRCRNQQTFNNWGNNGTQSINYECLFTSTGKNVDVVIFDGCFDPAHPEFAVNEDGSGGSRVNQFNWFSLNPAVTGGAAGTYLYTDGGNGSYTTGGQQEDDNNHGCHVAGTVAGNQRGWAREANIYNINIYGSAPSTTGFHIDYVREWHNTKDVNPETGKKNPTVTNHSYIQAATFPYTDIYQVEFRGQTFTTSTSWTAGELADWGITTSGSNVYQCPIRSTAYEADINDAVADGILFVAAAGNSDFEVDVNGGQDYNNYLLRRDGGAQGSGTQYINRYNQGASPGALPGVINVGAIDANVTEEKATYSQTGPGIDVFAPGSNIISSVHSGGVNDGRVSGYRVVKYNGTSMASPQVCGVLACLAEHWPRMTQFEAESYFNKGNPWMQTFLATNDQLVDAGRQTTTIQVSAAGFSDYSFSGDVSGADPTVTVSEGEIIRFELNCPSHPFVLKWDATGGSYNGDSGYDHDLMNFSNDANYPGLAGLGLPNIWHVDTNGNENYTSTMFQQTSGTLIFDTRGMNPGTYHYQCAAHGNMWGNIIIEADTSNRSLHGAVNTHLRMPNIRRVPNPVGATYIGAVTDAQVSWPRLDNKFRAILDGGGDIDQDVHPSYMIYPRHPIWSRKLT